MRKIISIILSCLLLVGMLPLAAQATDGGTATERDTSWYSDNQTTFNISTSAELLGFSDLLANGTTFSGKIIKLKSDIVLNEDWTAGSTAPVDKWADGSTMTFGGTFDGNGKTISGIYLSASEGASANRTAIFGGYGNGATVKNLAITNSYVEGGTYLGAIFGQGYGNVTIENVYCDVYVKTLATGNGQAQVGGLIGEASGRTTSVTTVKNTVFAGMVDASGSSVRAIGGMIGRIGNSEVTMTGCAFYGRFTGNHTGQGVLVGRTELDTSKLTLKGCIAAGEFTNNATDTNVSYTGSFYGQSYKVASIEITDCYYTEIILTNKRAYQPIPTYNDVIAPKTGSTYYSITEAELRALTDEALTVKPGLESFVAVERGYPMPAYVLAILRGEVVEESPMPDDHWYTLEMRDATPTVFVIDSAEDMLAFSECLENDIDFAECTVELACDVDLNEGWSADGDTVTAPEKPWRLLSGGKRFAGTFDGKGNSVSGIYIKTSAVTQTVDGEEVEVAVGGVGIFGNVGGGTATVKNLVIANSYIECEGGANGGIFGFVRGGAVVDGVYLDINMNNTGNTACVGMGGFIGQVASGSIVELSDSVFAGIIKTENTRLKGGITGVGGFIGASGEEAEDVKTTVTATDCGFFGNMDCAAHMAGGFMGTAGKGEAGEHQVTLKGVIVGGRLYTGNANWNGSLCGQLMSGTLTAENCYHIAFSNAGEACERAVFGAFKGFDSYEGCILVSDMDIRGEDVGEWLTSAELSGWSATEGYPMPTVILNSLADVSVPGLGETPNDYFPTEDDTEIESDTDVESDAESDTEIKSDTEIESDTEVEIDTEAEGETEVETEAEIGEDTEGESETVLDTDEADTTEGNDGIFRKLLAGIGGGAFVTILVIAGVASAAVVAAVGVVTVVTIVIKKKKR